MTAPDRSLTSDLKATGQRAQHQIPQMTTDHVAYRYQDRASETPLHASANRPRQADSRQPSIPGPTFLNQGKLSFHRNPASSHLGSRNKQLIDKTATRIDLRITVLISLHSQKKKKSKKIAWSG
jgi:hypothetical protein